MAAANVAFRAMMLDLGFTQGAADEINTGQGVDSTDIMAGLSDEDVETLMRVTRKPGGGGDGQSVSFVAERNFKDACQMARHYHQTQRTIQFPTIRTAALGPFKTQRRVEREYMSRGATPDPPKIDFVDHPKALEMMTQYLGQYRGAASGILLPYVIRTVLVPPAEVDDPATNYLTLDAERVGRAPIVATGAANPTEEDGPWDPVFSVDDSQAYNLLVGIMQGNKHVWTHVKGLRVHRSARRLIRGYIAKFLGPSRCDAEVKAITKQLQEIRYHGRNRGFTLEKALTRHVECHERLSGLEEYGYEGLNEGLKVSYLTEGILAPHLQCVTAQILASPPLRIDFDGSANLYRDFERCLGDSALSRNVSGVGSGDVVVEDRYYTDDEYNKLSNDQRKELRRIRQGKSGGGDSGGRGNGSTGKSASAKDCRPACRGRWGIRSVNSRL